MSIFIKEYIEKVKINVCNLERTKIILGMLWLVIHNSEINWKMKEVKMTRCPPLCEKKVEITRKVKEREKRIQKNKLRRIDKRDKND